MEIPFHGWHVAIFQRRSRRRYDSTPLEPAQLDNLKAICREFRPFPQARAELIDASPDEILRGAIGSYGKIKGAPTLIAFIGDMKDPHVHEKVGYTGEGIILEATAMGLSTCWVGGSIFFRRGVAASLLGIRKQEKVLAVTPVGRPVGEPTREETAMTGFGLFHKRKPLVKIVTGLESGKQPHWVRSALDAARLAPSAVNRQPWRFHVEVDSITVSMDNPALNLGISKRLDCGIAMLHIEVAALDNKVKGEWQLLTDPKVARFKVKK
ncbi:MAG: nitroreductase [Chloroflexi bacterium]|nr:nitroreductase [Chloroflexota bacterium]